MPNASNHGGRRAGAGQRKLPGTEIPAALAEQFAEWAEADFQKLYEAVADRAFGHYVIVKKDHRGRRPASPLPPGDLVTADGEAVRGYWQAGDAAAQKILIEQLLGRAGAKTQTQQETSIVLNVAVPRPPLVTAEDSLPFGLPQSLAATPADSGSEDESSTLLQELIDGAECLAMHVDPNDLHERGIGIGCMCEELYPAAYEEHGCPECLRGACTDCWLESQAAGRRGQCLPCAARWNPKARSIQLEREAEAKADAEAKAAQYTVKFKIISGAR